MNEHKMHVRTGELVVDHVVAEKAHSASRWTVVVRRSVLLHSCM